MLSLRVLKTPKYVPFEKADMRAISLAHVLTFTVVNPASRTFHLPPHVLPFGLCRAVKLSTDSAASIPVSCKYRITLRKSNGMRTSEWQELNTTVNFFSGETENDDDAHHDHLKTMFARTGHDFRYRYFAALTLMSITLEFDGPPPGNFELGFLTANGIDKSVSLSEASTKLERREPLAFCLPPVVPKDRLLAAAGAQLSTSQAPASAQ